MFLVNRKGRAGGSGDGGRIASPRGGRIVRRAGTASKVTGDPFELEEARVESPSGLNGTAGGRACCNTKKIVRAWGPGLK